jgi:hypothetical protein
MHRIHPSYNSTSKSFGTRADNSNYRRHHRPAALYTHTGLTQDCSYFVYIRPLSLHIYMAHVHWLFSFSFHQGLVWDICITIAHITGRQALKHFKSLSGLHYYCVIFPTNMILQAHAQASMGGHFGLFTSAIFIRISQYPIPIDLTDSCYAAWRWTLSWCGLAFCFFFATLQGTLSPAYLVQACSFVFLLFLLVLGHHYARGTSARGKLFCCNGRYSGAF